MGTPTISRRGFGRRALTGGVAMGLAQLTRPLHVLGANDRVRCGFIGVANRGTQLLDAFMVNPDMEVAALCDVDDRILGKAAAKVGAQVPCYKDWRKLLEQRDLDAVVIATPDHWHALQTIAAADAGKDIYVEKPLSVTIYEGRRMVEAVRRNNVISQVGTNRRSLPHFIQGIEMLRAGKIGKVSVARAYRVSNMAPAGIGNPPDSAPPPELDWDMWLGPRPYVPFNESIHPYKFRWHKLYSSQMTNWGTHYVDMMLWGLGVEAPTKVVALGGKYVVQDSRTVPDTLEVTYEFPNGAIGVFGQYEATGGEGHPGGEGNEFRGTEGIMYFRYANVEIEPCRGGQFQDPAPRLEPFKLEGKWGDTTHPRDFLDCVKSRKQCTSDIEVGHRSTSAALLGNIALEVQALLFWDPVAERFTNNEEANKLLHYEYRKPWTLT